MAHLRLDAPLDAPPEQAYRLARDFGAFRQWMRDIRSLTVVESGPGWQISEWRVARFGQVYVWRERDAFDDAARTIRTHLLGNGFLDHFDLECRFLPEGTGTKLSVEVTFQAAFAAPLVDLVAIPLVRRNFTVLTNALRARLDGTS